MRNKIRLCCVGLLCAGLLLGGIGLGVGFAEFSSFSYAGERVPETAQAKSQILSAPLPESGDVDLAYNNYTYPTPPTATLTLDETIPQGTVRFAVNYRTVGPEPVLFENDFGDMGGQVYLNIRHGRELPLVLACKDQLLADLRLKTIGTYLPMEVTETTVSVNPADAHRITNSVTPQGALTLNPH